MFRKHKDGLFINIQPERSLHLGTERSHARKYTTQPPGQIHKLVCLKTAERRAQSPSDTAACVYTRRYSHEIFFRIRYFFVVCTPLPFPPAVSWRRSGGKFPPGDALSCVLYIRIRTLVHTVPPSPYRYRLVAIAARGGGGGGGGGGGVAIAIAIANQYHHHHHRRHHRRASDCDEKKQNKKTTITATTIKNYRARFSARFSKRTRFCLDSLASVSSHDDSFTPSLPRGGPPNLHANPSSLHMCAGRDMSRQRDSHTPLSQKYLARISPVSRQHLASINQCPREHTPVRAPEFFTPYSIAYDPAGHPKE